MNSAARGAITGRLNFLRRDLEIAEREAAREPLDVSALPADQRRPFQLANMEIAAARMAIPFIRREIEQLEKAIAE